MRFIVWQLSNACVFMKRYFTKIKIIKIIFIMYFFM